MPKKLKNLEAFALTNDIAALNIITMKCANKLMMENYWLSLTRICLIIIIHKSVHDWLHCIKFMCHLCIKLLNCLHKTVEQRYTRIEKFKIFTSLMSRLDCIILTSLHRDFHIFLNCKYKFHQSSYHTMQWVHSPDKGSPSEIWNRQSYSVWCWK